jgi:hypothetical protein
LDVVKTGIDQSIVGYMDIVLTKVINVRKCKESVKESIPRRNEKPRDLIQCLERRGEKKGTRDGVG